MIASFFCSRVLLIVLTWLYGISCFQVRVGYFASPTLLVATIPSRVLDNGQDFTVLPLQQSSVRQILTALSDGDLDVSIGIGSPSAALAIARGLPVQVFYLQELILLGVCQCS